MISLGVYKPEFETTIKIYAGLVDQYTALSRQFKKVKYEVTEKTGYSDNSKKSPIVNTLESLRKDILAYSNALGLTPSGLKKLNDGLKENNKKQSKLDKVMSSFGQ